MIKVALCIAARLGIILLTGRTCALVFGLVFAPVAQAQAAYSPPRDAYGHADLGGVWISRWLTPLERQPTARGPVVAPEDLEAVTKAEWARHFNIDPIEGTDAFEYSTFVTVRGEIRSSLIVDPPDGRLPLVPEARAKLVSRVQGGLDGPEQRALNERCIVSGNGLAPHIAAPSGNIRLIVQTERDVAIHTELISQLRIIPTDGRTTVGYRRENVTGRWDGDALVVETTGIMDPNRGSRGSLFPVTPKTKIVERFARTGPDEITYSFTVEDPQLYTRPWKGETVMLRTKDRMYEFACHEGNYGLYNMLASARVLEGRAAANGVTPVKAR